MKVHWQISKNEISMYNDKYTPKNVKKKQQQKTNKHIQIILDGTWYVCCYMHKFADVGARSMLTRCF